MFLHLLFTSYCDKYCDKYYHVPQRSNWEDARPKIGGNVSGSNPG